MRRTFYFSGHRLTAFHWKGKLFTGSCSFESDQEGYDKFRAYLAGTANVPSRMLVDVIEEDFRKEDIPHVHGRDRSAVISRLMDRYYRSSRQYTYSEIIGRHKSGRKDDIVLLGAITNPSLIRPWIAIIEEQDVPLSGIWSLPLVSKQLLPLIGARKGAALVVSQQVNSNLRQTFFRDGKMLSSRQSVVNQDAGDISRIGTHAAPEVERTLLFMRNQHQVALEEIVHVHILASDIQLESLNRAFRSDDLHHYHIHRISDLHQKAGIREVPDKFSDGLFVWLCTRARDIFGHYGAKKEFDRFYYALASAGLYAASVLVIIGALLMAEANISEGMAYKKSTALLMERADEFRRVYEEKYAAYEPLFSDAGLMDAAVGLIGQVESNSRNTPLDFMRVLSSVINRPAVGEVDIDRIEWTTRQISPPAAGSRRKNGAQPQYRETAITSDAPIEHVAIVKGRIPFSAGDYRESVNRINNIISILEQHERIASVTAISLPVETRPDKKFEAESGAQVLEGGSTVSEGAFSLEIIMKAREHA